MVLERWRQGRAFGFAACSYWLEAFPQTRREQKLWRTLALRIPDPSMRDDALLSIDEKWGHSEGAAAFAALVPRDTRRQFVRMVVAYQLMIDYLDTTSERQVSDPWANTVQLHRAAQAAVSLDLARQPEYYIFHSHCEDGGFLPALASVCAEVFRSLPSAAAVAGQVRELTALYAESQGFCHAEQAESSLGPTSRIDAEAARFGELAWGDVLAASNTSVSVFALMSLAATPDVSQEAIDRCAAAYFPWFASLHILLHSLVDEAFDLRTGKFNQLGHYGSKAEAAEALSSIATRAREQVEALPNGGAHLAVLGGMVGYYLASPVAWQGENRQVSEAVLRAVAPTGHWALRAHRLRRKAG